MTARAQRGAWTAGVACLALLVAPGAGASDDDLFAQQWALESLGAPAAWQTSTGAGVTIGIVDTGVDASNPDLAGKIDASADCVGGSCREGPAPDRRGHGTAVAAVAAAATGNGVGIAGVAPEARLVIAKALDDGGEGETLDINNAIRWVVDQGARIVNLSLGDPDITFVSLTGTSLRSGIEYAWSRGAIPVLASGNYGDELGGSGSYNYGDLNAVIVGAADREGSVPRYSVSLGNAKWGVVAPGGNGEGAGHDVLAPVLPGRFGWVAGTSLAAPHVAGTLALLLAQGLSPADAVHHLLDTADASRSCGEGCRGHVRADAAVAAASAAISTASEDTGAAPSTTAPAAIAPEAALSPPEPGHGLSTPLVAVALALVVTVGCGCIAVALRSA